MRELKLEPGGAEDDEDEEEPKVRTFKRKKRGFAVDKSGVFSITTVDYSVLADCSDFEAGRRAVIETVKGFSNRRQGRREIA